MPRKTHLNSLLVLMTFMADIHYTTQIFALIFSLQVLQKVDFPTCCKMSSF